MLYELQSQLETMKSEQQTGKEVNPGHLEVIKTNLPLLTSYCKMDAYEGDWSYSSLYDYMKEAENLLTERSNRITLLADKQTARFVKENGKDVLLQLKRDNYNLQLEDCVIGMENQRMLDVIDNHIVARTGLVFLTPLSHNGRAPFYSSEKIIGDWHIKTIWFNLSILLLMSIIVTWMLLTDCPGRFVRKDAQ